MIVYRQDGSEADLSEEDAQKWLAMGLATTSPPGALPERLQAAPVEKIEINEEN